MMTPIHNQILNLTLEALIGTPTSVSSVKCENGTLFIDLRGDER